MSELTGKLRSSAKAFRKHPIHTEDGDPVLLTVQADELDQAADIIERQATALRGHVALMAQMNKYAARAQAAEASLAIARGGLEAALAGVDTANKACPINTSSRNPDNCPKCGATSSQNCGPNVSALSKLETIARDCLAVLEGGGTGSSSAESAASPVSQADCSAAQSPAGWVLVPKEPTREMWAASGDALVKFGHRLKRNHDMYSDAVWSAMLAAAPEPITEAGVRVGGEG